MPPCCSIWGWLEALAALHGEGRITEGAVTVDFYGARVDADRRLAGSPEYAPFIRLMGHVPRTEALKAQYDADLLLLLESPDPRARGVLTGKVFEYSASGNAASPHPQVTEPVTLPLNESYLR